MLPGLLVQQREREMREGGGREKGERGKWKEKEEK